MAYDIADDKRRRKVFKYLKKFGLRTQYSFFECLLSDMQLVELAAGLKELIDVKADRVGIMNVCEHCFDRIERMGYEAPALFEENDLVI